MHSKYPSQPSSLACLPHKKRYSAKTAHACAGDKCIQRCLYERHRPPARPPGPPQPTRLRRRTLRKTPINTSNTGQGWEHAQIFQLGHPTPRSIYCLPHNHARPPNPALPFRSSTVFKRLGHLKHRIPSQLAFFSIAVVETRRVYSCWSWCGGFGYLHWTTGYSLSAAAALPTFQKYDDANFLGLFGYGLMTWC
jgi:hypothetical protein